MSKLRANQIVNKASTGAPTAPNGLVVTGVSTATSFSGSGANLTSLPAANLTGTLPAISAANLTNVPAANITGTLPAIDGSNLTGISGGIGAVNQGLLRTASQLANVAGDFSVNLSTSITPTKAGSKILVMASVSSGSRGGTSAGYVFKLYRSIAGGTAVRIDAAGGDSPGNRPGAFITGGQEHGTDWVSKTGANNYLDTPSYSLGQTVQYLIYAGGAGGSDRVINRNWRDSNDSDNPRCMSSITIMEILQ